MPGPDPKMRPAVPEDTLCTGCKHPLSDHTDGQHNPCYWMGPEYRTGCEASLGIGDAGTESCSCHYFHTPRKKEGAS